MELEGSYTEDEMNLAFKYFISYVYFKNGKVAGYGNCEVSRYTPIYGGAEMNEIRDKLLEENPEWDGVTILSWMRFEED